MRIFVIRQWLESNVSNTVRRTMMTAVTMTMFVITATITRAMVRVRSC